MAPPPQIPKGVSSPIDPGAPSLLTSVPPEVRNMIYSVLFSRDQVLVHNSKAYHAEEPDREGYVPGTYTDNLDAYHQVYQEEIGGDIDFQDGLSLSLPILRTCRQVYHESVGVLYGHNTFVISRALNRHDNDDDGLHGSDESGYSQLSYAPLWLSQLGSQATLLRKVLIDVNALCPSTCSSAWDYFDILPILRFLWFQASDKCSFAFAHTERKLTEHEPDADIGSDSESVSAVTFNNMLHALLADDGLRIKYVARSQRILETIQVSARDGRGVIRHRRNGPIDFACLSCEEFEIIDEGRTLRRKKESTTSNRLDMLTWHMLRYIISLVSIMSSPRDEVVFDMDKCTVRDLPIAIFHVNRKLRMRSVAPLSVGMVKEVALQALAKHIITNFGGFRALQHLMPSKRSNTPFKAILTQSSCSTRLTVDLQIKPELPSILDEVRIDIGELIAFSCHADLGRNVSVCITLWHANDAGAKSTTTISFHELRRRVFLLLSDVLVQWPSGYPTKVGKQLPSIWINGHGAVLEASYPSTAGWSAYCVHNSHARLRSEEVMVTGYRMTNDVRLPLAYVERTEKWPRSLYATWEGLRDSYWADHATRRPGQMDD